MKKVNLLCIIVATTVLLVGCSSYVDISLSEQLYKRGDYEGAYLSLQQKAPDLLQAQGTIIVNYDLGMLSRLQGNYAQSNAYLSESERRIWESYTQSITANVASFLVNDNTKEYTGEEYEDIYSNIFKALNYIHTGAWESALVELNRSIEKQAYLKQKYEQQASQVEDYAQQQGLTRFDEEGYASSFSTSALAQYLTVIVAQNLKEENTYHYAMDQVRHAFASQPALYRFPLPEAVEREKPVYETSKGRLYLLSFTGQAPYKDERWESVYVSYANWAKIVYPVLVERPSAVQAIQVQVEGQTERLERIESISTIAIDTFAAKQELVKLKAVTRAMAKAAGIALYDAIAQEDDTVTAAEEIMGLLFRVFREVSEQADVRSTHFLPSEAWVGSLDLDPGTYTVIYSFLNNAGQTLYTVQVPNLLIQSQSTTVAEATCPF